MTESSSSVPAARGLTGAPGTRLGRLLPDELRSIAPLRGVYGAPERVLAEVSAEAALAATGAADEDLAWEEPVTVGSVGELLELSRKRGRDSAETAATRPELLVRMQLGSWFDAPWRTRALRRLRPVHRLLRLPASFSRRWLELAADLAFWDGVRESTDAAHWARWTSQSFTVLVYHRFSGELRPGQERIDIAPARFRRQLAALRLLGFRPLPSDELISFLDGGGDAPARSVVITADDAIADCLGPLARAARWHPQLYVPTAEVGGEAHWLDDRPAVAGWEELRKLAAAGVGIGSHAAHHQRLTEHSPGRCDEELTSSRRDLAAHLEDPLPLLAYPNGAHDRSVCEGVAEAGYAAAFTTEKGRNGAGSHRLTLKRVSVHYHDGPAAIVWKALTGEALPAPWARLRSSLRR